MAKVIKPTKKEQVKITRRLKEKYPQMYEEGSEKYWGKPVKKGKKEKKQEKKKGGRPGSVAWEKQVMGHGDK